MSPRPLKTTPSGHRHWRTLGDGRHPREKGLKVDPVGDNIASTQHLMPLIQQHFRVDETVWSEGGVKEALVG